MKKVALCMILFCTSAACLGGFKNWIRRHLLREHIVRQSSAPTETDPLLSNPKLQSISNPYNGTVKIPIYETDKNGIETTNYIRMDIKLYWLLISNGLFQPRDVS